MPKGLTGTQLKLIALITMTVDHIGQILFPQVLWLRLVGRLAFPIYAFMIAEGCRYTRSMPRYLGSVAAVAVLCQVATTLFGSLYQCIMVTFTMSIGLIFLLKKARDTRSVIWWLLSGLAVAVIWFVTQTLPELLPGTDYSVDYGFLGVMLPVSVWLMPTKFTRLVAAAGVLLLLGSNNWVQLFALGSIPLLALYSGQRGRHHLKSLFYWYYPAHLAVLHLLAML